ncbi:MAG: hypothetical protein KatS3mg044_0366 [Rhodothermaceae bacterium]|nr:MAG: hypothetical protein KatS3mg044_0366 [Rhodothermaceae bacterium]
MVTGRFRYAGRRWVYLRVGWCLAFGLVCHLALGRQVVPVETWRWSTYGTEAGLPSASVLEIVQTTTGRVWVRTPVGVAWYDDFRWHALTPGGPGALPTALVAGLEGEVWVVVADSLLYRGRETGFEPVAVRVGGTPLAVQAAVPFEAGQVLVLAGQRLYLMQDGEVRPFAQPPGAVVRTVRLPGLWRTRSGRIWVRTADGLYVWDGRTWQPWGLAGVQWLVENERSGAMALEGNSLTAGVWTWDDAAPSPRRQELAGQALVQALDVSPAGELLLVRTDRSVFVRDAQGWRRLDEVPSWLPKATFLLFEAGGDLWVGTPEGLAFCRRTVRRWDWWGDTVPELASAQINVLLRTRDGGLWAGADPGLFYRDPSGRTRVFREIEGKALWGVTALAEDSEGHIWVAGGGGLFSVARWDGRRWHRYGPEDGLGTTRIHRIYRDRAGHLWFLGLGATGAEAADSSAVFHVSDGRFYPWEPGRELPSRRIYAMVETPDGAFCFGTLAGLSCWKNGWWRHWSREDGLRDDKVFTLDVAPDGTLWFGHQHQANGLGYLDPRGRLHYLTAADGLPDERVWEVRTDAEGGVWASTESGLVYLHEGILSVLGSDSGLRHLRLWPLLLEDDRILVGTLGGGLYTLYLDERAVPAPLLDVQAPVVRDGIVQVSWKAYPYRGQLPPDRVLTRSRVDRKAWSPWSTRRDLEQDPLAPGTHLIEVQAQSLFGRVSTASVTVEVVPPFYLRPVFLLGVLLWVLGMAGVGGLVWQRQHRRLQQREAYFRALIENSSDLIVVVCPEGRVHYISPSVRRLLGYPPEDFQEQHLTEWIHPDDRTALRDLVQQAWKQGPTTRRVRFRNREGAWRTYEAVGQTIEGGIAGHAAIVINARDVTEREAAEARVRALNAELEVRVQERTAELEIANRELAAFSYSVSHDLRAPLRAVRGFAEILMQKYAERFDDTGRRYLDHILTAGEKMDRLINDLLLYARLGQKAITLEPVPLAEIFHRLRQTFGDSLASTGACLDLPEDLPQVLGNPTLLDQIFANLIDNALKYRRADVAPHVRVQWAFRGDFVEVSVSDNGIGIPASMQDKIFQMFQRLHRQDEVPGTGIGLALVKRAVERLGGDIEVVSEPGVGSTFTVRLLRAEGPVPETDGLHDGMRHRYFGT